MAKIVKVGGSHMVTLPREVITQANLAPHEEVVTVAVRDGSW